MVERALLDRRRWLQLAAASAAALGGPRGAFSQPRLADSPFILGVASGSPAADSVVLWTRLVHESLGRQAVGVRWELAHDERFQRIAQSGESAALPELAHSVHVEPAGLEPDRSYFYRFSAGGWSSPVGRTRTLPRADAPVARLRVAYASCQRWEHGHYAAWRHLRADDPDFVLFLGDYIYEYPTAVQAVRPGTGTWAVTLQNYRDCYALYKSDRELQAMHEACPWFVSWDDHEVQNDYAGFEPGDSGYEVPDFAARRAAAYQAYYEHMPLRASVLTRAVQGLGQGAEMRIYSRHAIGRLASLYVLDARQYRDPHACTRGGRVGSSTVDPAGCAIWNDARRTLLGGAQEQWLAQRLAQPGGAWTLIGQSTLFAPRNQAQSPRELYWNDGWDGYPAARTRLVQALQHSGAANPVIFGGDVHENWVGHVKADFARPESASVAVEFCGTSISSRPTGKPERIAGLLARNPHFVFADAYKRGYGLAEFTPRELQVSLRAVDDVTRADSGIATLARFRVQAGRPVIEGPR